MAGAAAAAGFLAWATRDLPTVEGLRDYRPPGVTTFHAQDGEVVGEVFEERRYVVRPADLPPAVVQAFVDAEDERFFEHGGVDLFGILRAAWRNLREGRLAEGGSTITQQVARSFLLGREKTLLRKVREAVLARRIERVLDKQGILHLYLNQIYLGEGAYGVEAAAREYFGRPARDLLVHEAALLAGLPQAPSRWSPRKDGSAARARQRYVLARMVEAGHLTGAEAEGAAALPLCLAPEPAPPPGPYYVEGVRRELVARHGHAAVYRGGLRVDLAMDAGVQRVADQAVRRGTRDVQRRRGWTGPIARVPAGEVESNLGHIDADRRLAHAGCVPLAGDPPLSGPPPALAAEEHTRGVVVEVGRDRARVRVGSLDGEVRLEDARWAVPFDPDGTAPVRRLDKLTAALAPGDLVAVRVLEPAAGRAPARLALEFPVDVDGALLSVRARDGAVLALVGGRDFGKDEFDLVTQAKRQPGSAFKPFVYSAALDHPSGRFTPSTLLLDAPVVGLKEAADGETELWRPDNADGEFLGETTLRRGLALSRNNVTLRLLQDIGVPHLSAYLKRFGFETPLREELGMGLGSSEVTPWELVRAYTVFATLGDLQQPNLVLRVRGRDGKVLEDRPSGPREAGRLDPATAFVMANLLSDVVRSGTATRALELGKPVAGKTGTTNGFKDAWFVGFTPEVVTGVWVGYRRPASLGRGQYGADCALPIWIETMREVLGRYPEVEFQVPDGVEWATVDVVTGRLAREDTPRKVRVAFLRGTPPRDEAAPQGEVDPADFFAADRALSAPGTAP